MKFIALKTDDGRIKGNISFYCSILHVSREGFRRYLINRDKPWKYAALAEEMYQINIEDECNDTYGRLRMYQALLLKKQQEFIFQAKEPSIGLWKLSDLVTVLSGSQTE